MQPFSHPPQSSHCSIPHHSPVLSLLKTLPPSLESLLSWFLKCHSPTPEEDLGLELSPVTSYFVWALVCVLPATAQDATAVSGTSCPYHCDTHSGAPPCSLPSGIHTPFRVLCMLIHRGSFSLTLECQGFLSLFWLMIGSHSLCPSLEKRVCKHPHKHTQTIHHC